MDSIKWTKFWNRNKNKVFHQWRSACTAALQSRTLSLSLRVVLFFLSSLSFSFSLPLFLSLCLLSPGLSQIKSEGKINASGPRGKEREAAGMKRWRRRRDEEGARREMEGRLQVFESPLKGELRSISTVIHLHLLAKLELGRKLWGKCSILEKIRVEIFIMAVRRTESRGSISPKMCRNQ